MDAELKIYIINAGTFLISLTDIDDVLRVSLLVVSIIYTVVKTWQLIKNDKTLNK